MSWVIKEKATGKVICETFNASLVAMVNTVDTSRYEAVPILDYLASLNASQAGETVDPASPRQARQPVGHEQRRGGQAHAFCRLARELHVLLGGHAVPVASGDGPGVASCAAPLPHSAKEAE